MDDLYTIDTPENIEFAYDVAGIGSRFLAAIVDSFLILIGLIIVGFALAVLLPQLGFDISSLAETYVIILVSGGILLLLILYYVVFDLVWNGQSPGKRLIGLRVVRDGGRPVTFLSSVIRNFIRIADFLPALYGVGVIAMFIDKRSRRLGDLAGGTLVVKERRGVTLESLTANTAPIVSAPKPGDLAPQLTLANVNVLNDQDYTLVQEFLRRRTELSREARTRLGVQLASGLQARLGIPQGGDAERFLEYTVREYQMYRQQASS